jgi:hypothetical protein
MKREYFFGIGLVPLIIFSVLYFNACSATKDVVNTNELPNEVFEGFKKAHPDVLYADWTRANKNNQTIFESTWKRGNKTHTDTFDAKGNLIDTN